MLLAIPAWIKAVIIAIGLTVCTGLKYCLPNFKNRRVDRRVEQITIRPDYVEQYTGINQISPAPEALTNYQ